MKYICLGYIDEKMWEGMSEKEQKKFVDECFAYDAELTKKDHMIDRKSVV